MDTRELNSILENEEFRWKYENPEHTSLLIRSLKWDNTVRIDMSRLPDISTKNLEMALVGGKNVEQITRVTGFFSKVGSWNKGKTGELKERHRIGRMTKKGFS